MTLLSLSRTIKLWFWICSSSLGPCFVLKGVSMLSIMKRNFSVQRRLGERKERSEPPSYMAGQA